MGCTKAFEYFINDPTTFYFKVRQMYKGDIALFEVPCSICGKPMIFNHRNKNWKSEVKPTLLKAFKNFIHVHCEKQYSL